VVGTFFSITVSFTHKKFLFAQTQTSDIPQNTNDCLGYVLLAFRGIPTDTYFWPQPCGTCQNILPCLRLRFYLQKILIRPHCPTTHLRPQERCLRWQPVDWGMMTLQVRLGVPPARTRLAARVLPFQHYRPRANPYL
jgi:hypothetical protein